MINYEIIENPNYTDLSIIGINLNPDILCLKFFFSSMRKENFPELINEVSKNLGYIGDPQGVIFYNDLDGEDFSNGDGFSENEVKVYHHEFGEVIISADLFKRILFDYTSKLKEVYENDKSLKQNWKVDIETALKKLKEQIE